MLSLLVSSGRAVAVGAALALVMVGGAQASTGVTLWTARDSNGDVVLDDWPLGAGGGQAGAYELHPVPSQSYSSTEFLGFQFAPDGTLWTARDSNGLVVLDDWPLGAGGGQAGAYELHPIPSQSYSSADFLGFQFAPDGTLWTARDSTGLVVLDDWPLGAGGGQAGAYELHPIPSQSYSSADFLGFQFVRNPTDPGSAVPEPATWAMMIAGFGLVGTSIRRRRMLALAS